MGRWEIRGLESRVGRECSVSIEGGRFHSEGIHVGGVQGGGSHSDSAGGTAPRVRAAKSSELASGKL